jgi:hypothetical protein
VNISEGGGVWKHDFHTPKAGFGYSFQTISQIRAAQNAWMLLVTLVSCCPATKI